MQTPPRSHRRGESRRRRGTARGRPSPEDRTHSPAQLRTRAAEKRGASVQGRLVDDLAEQVAERMAELRPRLEAELDQVVAVDREVGEAVRLSALPSQHAPEIVELLDVLEGRPPVLAGLAAVVGFLVIDEFERDLVAVLRETAARAKRIP